MKIPFARRLSDMQLTEVGDVPAGRDCKCVCPSCGLGVVARKGEVNEWHFAHDRHSEIAPHGPCDVSFFTCCRAFVIDQVTQLPKILIRTPDYLVEEKRHGFSTAGIQDFATRSKVLEPARLTKDTHYDLVAEVRNRRVFIHLSHPGRKLPEPESLSTEGLLCIDLSFMADQYKAITSQPELLKNLTVLMFEREINCKQWLFHPREREIRKRLRKRLETEAPELNQAIPSRHGVISRRNRHLGRPTPAHAIPVKPPPRGRSGTFDCLFCSAQWPGYEYSDRVCRHCNSHLGSKFQPGQ